MTSSMAEASSSRTRSLPRLSIDSSAVYRRPSMSSHSSLSSSTRASFASSYTSMSSSGSFFVQCMFDFDTEDPDQLSFHAEEVLQIIRMEESGWWAALRDGEYRVGWVPSSYVEPISEASAVDRRFGMRSHTIASDTDGTDSLRTPADDKSLVHATPDSADTNWLERLKNKPLPPPPDQDAKESAEGRNRTGIIGEEVASPGQDIWLLPAKKNWPPSPAVPLPPTPKSAPLQPDHSDNAERKRSMTLPMPGLSRADSCSAIDEERAPSQMRLGRRRPLIIRDQVSLNRLSVLIETRSVDDVEDIVSSPASNITMDGPHMPTRPNASRTDKVKQITGDDLAQALHAARIAQVSCPWFLRPLYGDEQIKVDVNGTITSGTLPALIERLTLEPLIPALDREFRHAFLSTFKTMGTADEIFDLLLERYYLDAPAAISMSELDEWKTKRLLPVQRRVLSVFTTWLVDHNMIEDDPPIARRLQNFLTEITAPAENVHLAQQAMKALECLTFAVPVMPHVAVKPPKRRRTKDSKNELLRLDPTTVAENLCLYEHMLYSKIRPQECLDWPKKRSGEAVMNLLAFCTTHDKLASWVKHSVLWTENLGCRADIIDFWIKVAEKCRAMHNYSSMSAIVTALSSTVIQRLHLTWAHVSKTSHLTPLAQLNDPAGSFAACRHAQQQHDAPCVPFIGMYLTDIVHINDQHKDTPVPQTHPVKQCFSFVKRRKWSETLDIMLIHQRRKYAFTQEPMVTHYIEANLSVSSELDPATFWTKSQAVQQNERASADLRRGLEAAGF